VREAAREIDAWNREHGGKGEERFRLLKGIEADILADGRLDYDDDLLARLRLRRGLGALRLRDDGAGDDGPRPARRRHPHLTILGHATGRLLLRREGYAVDVDAVLDAAAEHGVAVEINADPNRLDVDWRTARYAAERGVLVAINPDAHSVAALGVVAYGVNVARKAWLTADAGAEHVGAGAPGGVACREKAERRGVSARPSSWRASRRRTRRAAAR
jgi:DNA polymerase (family X)